MWRSETAEALIQAPDPVGEMMDEMEVVRDKNDGESQLRMELMEEQLEFLRTATVNAGGGFVEQEELRLLEQSRRDEHPLKLASRQRSQLPMLEVRDAQPLQSFRDERTPATRHTAKPERTPLSGDN